MRRAERATASRPVRRSSCSGAPDYRSARPSPPTESDPDLFRGPGSKFRGMPTILWCPQCGERVFAPGEYTVGRHHARNQRSTCPQCHVELVRHPDLQDNAWAVDDPTPPPDEELGGTG